MVTVQGPAMAVAIARLDAWMETMRGPDGYGGPVAHWWQNCLSYTGPGLDWRYEGIVHAYVTLHSKTGDDQWLTKARRAGDHLVRGQLPSGNYRNSCFEANPYTGGTPHEAACDLALLRLAGTLRQESDGEWEVYLRAAERNLRGFQVAALWDAETRSFRDHPRIPSLVPNKACTLVEALFELAELSGDGSWIEVYAVPTLQAVLRHQVRGGSLDGAIAQYSQRGHEVRKYFPFYIARCVPGLLLGYQHGSEERFLHAARRALAFVLRTRYEDGSFPQVVYPGGRTNRYPQWIAAAGDILRAMALITAYGIEVDPEPTHGWLLRGQMPSGAFRTAHGFASQVAQRDPGAVPEFRDLLPVVGWTDKVFRYLTDQLPEGDMLRPAQNGSLRHCHPEQREGSRSTEPDGTFEEPCTLHGQRCLYREDARAIELRQGSRVLYRWIKGADWAEVSTPEVMWK